LSVFFVCIDADSLSCFCSFGFCFGFCIHSS
jgi:hypothetical protein